MVQICDRDRIKTMPAERERDERERKREWEKERRKKRNERKSCVIKNVLNSSSVIVKKLII